MALLDEGARWDIWRVYMKNKSCLFEVFGNFSKHELRIAVNETDAWVEAGAKGQLKKALSEPCKSELTSQQQNDLENLVTLKRIGGF